MINARHLECARKSFEYQQRLDVAVLGTLLFYVFHVINNFYCRLQNRAHL